MSHKRVIPCLDIAGGRVVKGVNFVGLRDAGDPVEIAARYDEQGADELTFLDITATSDDRYALLLPLIEAVAKRISIPLIVGGGIRSVDYIQRLLDAGAAKVSIGSAAISNPDMVRAASQKYGAQRIIAAIDAKQRSGGGWDVYTHGGKQNSGLDVLACAVNAVKDGAGEILVTSMDRDGVKNGYDLALTAAVSDAAKVPVIASGGAGSLNHLVDGVSLGKADAVLAASIFHFGEYTVREAKEYMASKGIPVKL
ncbi:MAG: imidazole glycerol phosphate synthase subunit HisF [Saezia sp.]